MHSDIVERSKLDTYLIATTSSPGLLPPLSVLLNHCGKTDDAFGQPEAKINQPGMFQ